LAADYLSQRGYSVLERNARTPYGEIDLVVRQDIFHEGLRQANETAPESAIVFVEVKTRSSTAFGFPEEAITSRKRERMLAAAQAYMQAHPDLDDDWRVDVIAVQRSQEGKEPIVTHFENAITEST
jgi:putative endonuclease